MSLQISLKISPQMNMKKREQSRHTGFSLVETMVTMSIFFVIMFGVYMMISHFGDVTKTEQARMSVQQANRFIGSVMADELKDAGAVLTLAHTGGFLSKNPYFNGIYPLNNNDFPDGIILAVGDPEAVTKLSSSLSAGSTVLNVDSELVPASLVDPVEYPPWKKGDVGMVLSDLGYLVFSVESVAANVITIRDRAKPVYASGQLDSPHYQDLSTDGNSISYDKGSIVMRLSNFAIYLFKETYDPQMHRTVRQLMRVSDTAGYKNVISDSVLSDQFVMRSVITENIWDMQLSYVGYDDFSTATRLVDPDVSHHFFAGTVLSKDLSTYLQTSTNYNNLLADINGRKIREINIHVATLTDAFGGMGKSNATLPVMGDRVTADKLPVGKFGVKVTYFSVELRNFSIVL